MSKEKEKMSKLKELENSMKELENEIEKYSSNEVSMKYVRKMTDLFRRYNELDDEIDCEKKMINDALILFSNFKFTKIQLRTYSKEIDNCFECPNITSDDDPNDMYCNNNKHLISNYQLLMLKTINKKFLIPEWCPLPARE